MGNSVNTATARLTYDNGKNVLVAAGMGGMIDQLTQGFLRLEQPLVVGKTTFNFPILVNQAGSNAAGVYPTEQRLNLQDSFIASQLGIFISNPASAADGAFKLRTYPNKSFFSTSGLAAALETIYNGILTVAVNNKTLIPAWDIARHRLVPQTQEGVGVTAETVFPVDQLDGSTDAFFPLEPNIILIGNKNSVVTMSLPAPLAVADATTRISLVFRGLLAQNSSSLA
jgi:hypothetical protein